MKEFTYENKGEKVGDFKPKIFTVHRDYKTKKNTPSTTRVIHPSYKKGLASLESQVHKALGQKSALVLDMLHTRGVVTSAQWAAGSAFHTDWERMQFLAVGEATHFREERVDGGLHEGLIERRLRYAEMEKKVAQRLRGQNPRGRFLIINICAENKSLQDIQQKTGWQTRYISERLREALDDLSVAYAFRKS